MLINMNLNRIRSKLPFIVATLLVLFPVFLLLSYNIWVGRHVERETAAIADGSLIELAHDLSCDGKTPAVLLLHGFGGSPWDMQPLFVELQSRGIACRVPCLPGHGESVRSMAMVTEKDWQETSRRVYREMKGRYGTVYVGGFSMGGALALLLAAEENVERIVLLAPYFQVSSRWNIMGSPESWAARLARFLPFIRKLKTGQIYDPEGLTRYRAYQHVALSSVAPLDRMGRKAQEAASRVSSAVLWFHSGVDLVADPELSRRIFDKLPNPQKTFVSLSRSNHVLTYDFEREQVIRSAADFLTTP